MSGYKSPYYRSPVDGHDHFTKQGRQRCVVCTQGGDVSDDIRDRWALAIAERDAAEAERARLQAVVWGETKLRAQVAGARLARDEAIAERDRLRAALLDILVVESLDSAHLLANGALNEVTSELDQVLEYAKVSDERDRLRAVVAAYQRAYHVLDHAFDDDDVDSVGPQYRDWKAAQMALLDTPTGDGKEGT